MIEYLEIAVLLQVIWTDFRNNGTNSVDIVSQNDAAHCLDKNHAKRFVLICWYYISESDSKHNRCSPVVAPNVFFFPHRLRYVFVNEPVLLPVQVGHGNQDDCKAMGNNEVKQENLNKVPDFLSVLILDKNEFDMSQGCQKCSELHENHKMANVLNREMNGVVKNELP